MRIKILLESASPIDLKVDYRRNFISLIKSAFRNSALPQDYFSKKEYKPYTFSTYLGNDFHIENESIKASKTMFFIFSTGDPIIFTNFYNGILSLKKDNIKISKDIKLKIADIAIQPYKKINAERVLFKTLGVSVLNNPVAPKSEFKKWYIIPTDDIQKFNECLTQRTNSRYQFITKKAGVHRLELILPANIENPIKETIVKHYDGNIRGFRGVFYLESSPEILQFVYDYGIGIRTGQGFGMLDVIKEG